MSTFETLEARQLLASIGPGATEIAIGDTRYFVATDAEHGAELWKSDLDGSNATLVKDIYAGVPGSSPQQLFNFNGLLVFSASGFTSYRTGRELWKSDGTAAGTALITNLDYLAGDSNPHNFMILNDRLIFLAKSNGLARTLYSTDGGSRGTVKLFTQSGLPSDEVGQLVGVQDGLLYFTGSIRPTLWQTDGTAVGTIPVPSNIVNFNGQLRITGTAMADHIVVRQSILNLPAFEVYLNGSFAGQHAFSNVHQIHVEGLAGDDTIDLSAISIPSRVYGGDGNDTIRGSSAADRLVGGEGNDSISGGNGNDSIFGEAGNDSIYGDADNDRLFGGNDDDHLEGGTGKNTIDHGILPPPRPLPLSVPTGRVSLDDHFLRITGTTGSDQIVVRQPILGLPTFEVYFGGKFAGSYLIADVDEIYIEGLAGNDTIDLNAISIASRAYGGAGNDVIHGSSASDRLVGGDGDDWINGANGHDSVFGEAGNDRLFGGDGNDYLNGGSGTDLLRGGNGIDRIVAAIGLDDTKGNKGDSLVNDLLG